MAKAITLKNLHDGRKYKVWKKGRTLHYIHVQRLELQFTSGLVSREIRVVIFSPLVNFVLIFFSPPPPLLLSHIRYKDDHHATCIMSLKRKVTNNITKKDKKMFFFHSSSFLPQV